MNRQAQAVVLLLFGGAVLRATLTDMHLRYVKAGLTPFLVAAGLVLLIAGVMTLIHDLRPPRAAARAAHDGQTHEQDDHGHDHGGGHHEPRVGWLLILPVLGLLLVAPPALGSDAAGRTGTALSSQGNSNFPPLPPGDPAKITVLDYASRAYFDKGVSMNGRSVELAGFVAKGPEGSQVLARIILSCCAADGRPIKVGMEGNPPKDLAENTWIRVVGTYSARIAKDPVNGETIPYLAVETWEQIDPPKQQYE
jgi:uncharacterized repeat protein (TIGR03943 family)